MKQSLTDRHSLIVEDVHEKLIRDQGNTVQFKQALRRFL